MSRAGLAALTLAVFLACSGDADDRAERFIVPEGAGLHSISDTLAAHRLIGWPSVFRLYVQIRGLDDRIKAGTYELPRSAGWGEIVDALVHGRVVTVPVTVPEGWDIMGIAPRIAPIVGEHPDTITRRLRDPELADSLGVPGPTLEGYLLPDTYRFAEGVSLDAIAAEMVRNYQTVWTPERRATLDSIGLSEREAVTLASIVQAEARWVDEMPLIAAVYHNRLRREMRLQADPTVQYALETRRQRLLFAHIDSVADNPYNTYTHAGLPPGPINSPGVDAIDAVLRPADSRFLYFVARPDGRHEFSRTLAEHNAAIRRVRQRR